MNRPLKIGILILMSYLSDNLFVVMKYKSFPYCFKIWLTSALITPVVVLPLAVLAGRSIAYPSLGVLKEYGVLVETSLAISLIPWLIILMFLNRLANSKLSDRLFKGVLFLIATALPGLIFLIGALNSDPRDWTGMLAYLALAIATSISLWLYKLKPVDTAIIHA